MRKKYEMKCVEEGYDDGLQQRFEEAKIKMKQEEEDERLGISNKPLNLMTTKKMIILVIWGLIYRLFIKWEFGMVYFFISIIVFIFTNLGKRKPWELSAYSIFNPNFERLPGTMSAGDLQAGMGFGGTGSINNNNDEEPIYESQELQAGTNNISNSSMVYETKAELKKRQMKNNAKQPLNSNCECGSNKKYKNCCIKRIIN